MYEKFEIGEIAIIHSSASFPEYIGTLCEVAGPLEARMCRMKDGSGKKPIKGYAVVACDGRRFRIPPRYLRKKPPREELGSWGKIPFAHQIRGERVV